jgi:ribosomal protein S18 acetylase RimI-like enzyme
VAESIRLRPIRSDELPALLKRGKQEYAESMVEEAAMSPVQAQRKADEDFAHLVPDGALQVDHFVYIIETDAGEAAGRIWWAIREDQGRAAFLYDIHLDERYRGRGLGRRAMALLEDDVRAHGLDRIHLNVWGGNDVARSLYGSLGYVERAVFMEKRLDG